MKTLSLRLLVTFLLVGFTVNVCHADPIDPSTEDPGEAVPVDGGISLLLAAGVAYGAKKIVQLRRKDILKKRVRQPKR